MVSRISITDVSRQLDDLVERARKGEEFVVERGGEAVCRIGPAGRRGATVSDLADLLDRLPRPDDAFWDEVEQVTRNQPPVPPSPWE
jgi:antitoxin (DNA-binding transcriptional repressor) of toxin-antitoxin stability system